MLETIKKKALLIAFLTLLGFGFGTVYVFASGAREVTTTALGVIQAIPDGETLFTLEEGAGLKEQAVDVALNDPRVKELVEGKQYKALCISGPYFTLWLKEKVRGEAYHETYRVESDWKPRALVAIIFADNSGYCVEVNLTDNTVENIECIQKF